MVGDLGLGHHGYLVVYYQVEGMGSPHMLLAEYHEQEFARPCEKSVLGSFATGAEMLWVGPT